MKRAKLEEAVTEAKRFLAAAEALREEMALHDWSSVVGTKASGAARRASMDLTRKLAELRK